MKNSKVLCVLGVCALMGLGLLADAPEGGAAQGAPAPAAGARAE